MVNRRRSIVAAIGGDLDSDAAKLARDFGAEVARAGAILLTGGAPWAEQLSPANRLQTKHATMLGALDADSAARLVAVLPSSTRAWQQSEHRLVLHTGLKHQQRNVITGATADVVVVFQGNIGTLSEIGFAAATSRPILFCASAEVLRTNLKTVSADGSLCEFFRLALDCYSEGVGGLHTPRELLTQLEHTLSDASDAAGTPRQIVQQALALVVRKGATGFPGLPGEQDSIERFETSLHHISQPGGSSDAG